MASLLKIVMSGLLMGLVVGLAGSTAIQASVLLFKPYRGDRLDVRQPVEIARYAPPSVWRSVPTGSDPAIRQLLDEDGNVIMSVDPANATTIVGKTTEIPSAQDGD